MRVNRTFFRCLPAAAVALLLSASSGFAVTIGEDDFDSNRTSLTFATTPADPGLNGLFAAGASRFDRWGIANRTTLDSAGAGLQALPFDLVDESVTAAAEDDDGLPFTADDFGIIKGTKTDNFFAIGDLENDENPSGTGTATWTFDISGYSDLEVSIDWAAIGIFAGTGDTIDVIATIDGGTPQLIMDGDGNSGAAYTVTMEGGVTYDRYQDPFWNGVSEALWGILTSPGQEVPFNNGSDVIDFSTDDLDQDGFHDISGEQTFQETNSNGTFQEAEANLYTDPMTINGVALNNAFQTISAPVTGTGSTLELTISVVQNGSLQFITFDDLLVEGNLGVAGDFDGDMDVDGADFLRWQRGETPDNGSPEELEDWEFAYGTPPSSIGAGTSAVPEPISAAMFLVGMALMPYALR